MSAIEFLNAEPQPDTPRPLESPRRTAATGPAGSTRRSGLRPAYCAAAALFLIVAGVTVGWPARRSVSTGIG